MATAWRPYWRRKRKKDRRQVSFAFLARPTRAIPKARREQVSKTCEIPDCGKPREDIDHICPVRLAAQTALDPHDQRNLMGTCKSHNLTKKKAERMLAAGNKLGFEQYLRERGWNMERVRAALAIYGWS